MQGRIQDFVKEGSESGVYIGGGANPSVVSVKQGSGGHSPQKLLGIYFCLVLRSHIMQDWSVF